MRLTQIRRSNRAKLARLEAKGYIFDEEYKQKVYNAKGKMKTSGMRYNAKAILDRKKGDIYVRGIDYSQVQIDKLKGEMYRYFNALDSGDTETAKKRLDWILSGKVSDKKPFRLSDEQMEQYKQRLVHKDIPDYGTQEYWRWRDFERNKDTFIERLKEFGVPSDFIEAASNDPGVMYRFNNSEDFITRFFDSLKSHLSETDVHSLLNDIFTKDFIEDYYKDSEVDGYDYLLQTIS